MKFVIFLKGSLLFNSFLEYQKSWTLDARSRHLDSGRLEFKRLDCGPLDAWTLDAWILDTSKLGL